MTVRSQERSIVGPRARGGRLLGSAAFGTSAVFGAEAELEAACCSVWFVSRSAEHESACAARPTRTAA
ncbi:hypothetical protein ACIRF8_19660 [Streptomyces sp. NPDC102406]|uniref:hypothetical protein n=1 Tax=Streptomyces sp. NPDC102406 TaxID=3366171 RepID=UPI0037F112E0